MKKAVSLILALVLALAVCSVSVADELTEVTGTVDLPTAGLSFNPPEEYLNAKAPIINGTVLQFDTNIFYAYWLYCAMTEDELNAKLASGDQLNDGIIELFYVFTIGNGMDFDGFVSTYNLNLSREYAKEIGKVGEYTFYLYMEGPNQDFINSINAAYVDEYTALAGLTDKTLAAFTCYEPVDKNAAFVGSKVEFTTRDLDGNPVSSADLFAQNEITLINIWATWCGPCVGELGELQQIHTRLQEKNCGILGLLTDNDLDSARKLMSDNGITYPVIQAPNNLYDLFPSEYIPTSVFVSRDGIILATPIVGAQVKVYESTLDSLLQK